MPINKVVFGSTTLIDISDTTAVASDVAAGKYFYALDGTKTAGTASGGGSVTITDEANATGITCVITTGGSPTPSADIPLNTELIDFSKATKDYVIDQNGNVSSYQWYSVSDYTPVASGMTFSYTGSYWFYIGVYDSNKSVINVINISSDSTVDPNDSNTGHGTLSGTELPANAAYVRITGGYNTNSSTLSLIRTA